MGCGSSAPAPPSSAHNGGSSHAATNNDNAHHQQSQSQQLTAQQQQQLQQQQQREDPQAVMISSGIDRDIDKAKQEEELKVKLLLLGAGESGKSTIFKQMRILYGSSRSDDDLKMYGVVIRSNVITAMRKLCSHLRSLGLEDQLNGEGKMEGNEMSPKEAYDLLVAHLVDNTAAPEDLEKPLANGDGPDWVGESPRAGLGANNDAKQFLQLWKPVKALWEVRVLTEKA